MLGKNDSLEVVLNPAHDPGADKRGLLIRRSGQVFSRGEDTGGACLQTHLQESLPERRWRSFGSTSLVYRYLPPRSNLPRRKARPNREKPAAWRRQSPARRQRTRLARYRAADRLPARGPPRGPFRRRETAAHRSRLWRESRAFRVEQASECDVPSSASRPTSAATALPDPAPSPPCTGSRFINMNLDVCGRLERARARETIFQAVLRSARWFSVEGTRGSFEVIRIVVMPARLAVTVTRSCISSV